MRITNVYDLPEEFVRLNLDGDTREPKKNRYHVTELLKPSNMIVLERRHFDDIVVDVSQSVNAILGTAVHKVMEEANKDTGNAEIPFEVQLGGDVVSGRVDLYDTHTSTIVDWKTTSVFKWKSQDFADYRKQGLIYAWGLHKAQDKLTEHCKFVLILKDWTASGVQRDSNYPNSPVQVFSFDVLPEDYFKTNAEVMAKLNEVHDLEQMPDAQLQSCPEEDRWHTPDKYACGKGPDFKRATKVFDTIKEAKLFVDTNEGMCCKTRAGEDKRCDNYCNVRMWCPFYISKTLKENKEEEE